MVWLIGVKIMLIRLNRNAVTKKKKTNQLSECNKSHTHINISHICNIENRVLFRWNRKINQSDPFDNPIFEFNIKKNIFQKNRSHSWNTHIFSRKKSNRDYPSDYCMNIQTFQFVYKTHSLLFQFPHSHNHSITCLNRLFFSSRA